MNRRNDTREISEGRKGAYYAGNIIALIGLLLFLSVFFTAAMNFGNFDNFEARGRSSMLRAISGMVLMIVGGAINRIGSHGLAGSGVVLDPQQARDDMHPYTNAAGGMIRDVLDGMDDDRNPHDPAPGGSEQTILIRCRECNSLNEETDNFCGNCGASLT